MKPLVVDASLVTHALTEAREHPLLWRQLEAHMLHAPSLIDFEVANALRGLSLGGKLDVADAEAALADFLDLPVTRHSGSVLAERIWRLRSNFNAYDAAYLALAELLDCPVLTGDAKLDNGAHGVDVHVYPWPR